MDHADYCMMRAPRPTLLCTATHDFFNIEDAWDTFRAAKRLYARLGHAERMSLVETDQPHGFSLRLREGAVHWMLRWLDRRDVPVVEPPDLKVLSDAEIRCTPKGEVMLIDGARSVYDLNRDYEKELAEKRKRLWDETPKAEILDRVRKLAGIRPLGDLPELKFEDLGTVEIVSKQTNFASAATSAIDLGAEAIVVVATQAEAVGMVAALYDRNYEGQIIGSETLVGPGVFDSNPDALADVPFPVYFLPSEVNAAGQRFVDAYEAEYGSAPDSFSAQGFNAVWITAVALAGAGAEPTRESLRDAFNALTEVPDTIYGTVSFENGQMFANQSVKIVSYSKPDGVIVPWTAP